MPNWCQNEVEVCGSPEDIKKLSELITDEGFFCNVLPLPKELSGYSSPCSIISEEKYAEQEEKYKEWLAKDKKDEPYSFFHRDITQEIKDKLIKEYGATNWYDWCINNWGCKWDIDTKEMFQYDEGADWIQLDFNTAWCPPQGIKDKLDEMFPELSISWFYKEPGCQISGWL